MTDFIYNDDHIIANLFTSENYGVNKNDIDTILVNTTLALDDFFNTIPSGYKIYSNKFNSGLLGVPWEKTEVILKVMCKKYNVTWNVCEI
jgi:hypothetical protein